MAEAIAFDTHRFVKHLTENGVTGQQAEVQRDIAEVKSDLLKWMMLTKGERTRGDE